jgi:hypothetical protein
MPDVSTAAVVLSLVLTAGLGLVTDDGLAASAPQAARGLTASTGLEDGLRTVLDDTDRFAVDLPVAFAWSTSSVDVAGSPVAHVSGAVDLGRYLAGDEATVGTSIFMADGADAGARDGILELLARTPGQVVDVVDVPGSDDVVIAAVRAPAPNAARQLLSIVVGSITPVG